MYSIVEPKRNHWTDLWQTTLTATTTAMIINGDPPTFGREDAVAQAATVEAVRTAARTGQLVTPSTQLS